MNSEILDRLPPQNLEAERGVLGSILLDSRANVIDDVSLIVRPDDFYADANQRLFRNLLAMRDEGQPIDVTLLAARLKREGEFEAIGGVAYLAEVAQSVPCAHNARYYAAIVRAAASLRAVIHAMTDGLRAAWDPSANPLEIVNQVESELQGIRTGTFADAAIDAQTAALKFIDRVDSICERKKHLGVPTGFGTFDSLAGGLFPGEFCILAARPSVGKTALAAQIAGHNSARGRLVYFVSLEMDDVELVQRDICGLSNVNSRSIRTGNLNKEDRQRLVDGAGVFSQRTVAIDSRPELKVYDIRRKARQLAKGGLALIVIDYIGLITPDDHRAPREQQVARISRELKALAKELNVPVLCLSQLNRAIADDERPTLANLRESGAIEQDAHMVMFIHRPEGGIWLEGYDETTKKKTRDRADWDAELILAKNRNGEKTTVKLGWKPAQTTFIDLAEPNDEGELR